MDATMKTIEQVMEMVRQKVADEAKEAGQMTLGGLINALTAQPQTHSVYFDFCNQKPGGLDSYRGFYEQLAISWGDDGDATVESLLKQCRDAVGSEFYGYKGGDYRMDEDTLMWVSNYGTSAGSRIVGVRSNGWATYLLTAPYLD